jgi:hypothetical protein
MEEKKIVPTSVTEDNCTVFHAKTKDGKINVVAVNALKVVIARDGAGWFAQGLDIDYAAGGSTPDVAKANFENGLVASIDLHLKAYNSISKLLKPAPQAVWQEMFYGPLIGQNTTQAKNYHQISVHSPDQIKMFTFFQNIEYFELALAA